jgi:hypothetical protein
LQETLGIFISHDMTIVERLELQVLACNLAHFLRTPALSEEVKQWSMTTRRERAVKIGAEIAVRC